MKKLRTYLTLLLVVCLVLPLFSACNTTETVGQTDDSGTAPDGGTVLTNIFSETPSRLPKEAEVAKNIIPYYDRESGTLTELLTEREEVTGEDNVIVSVYTGWLYTISDSGEILEKNELPLPEEVNSPGSGIVLPDEVICSGYTRTEEPVVWKVERTTGKITSTGSVQDMIGNQDFYPHTYAFDEEGRIYGTDNYTVFVLNPDLTLSFVYTFPMQISGMTRGADGRVWTAFNAGMEPCAAVIDPETKKLGTYYPFTRGMDGGYKPKHYLLDSPMNAGESAYNFFYYDKIGALWGVTLTEEGKLEETQVFDLFNSGISKLNTTGSSSDGDLFPIAFLTDELFLTRKFDWDDRSSTFIFHQRAEDIDMSEQSIITIAYADPLQASAVEYITEFKRTRPDVSIVLEDYSQYAVPENSRAGEEKLCFDLVNGFIKPDIVITDPVPYHRSTLSDSSIAVQLHRNNLYVDLVPYLEKDDELNFDNLFGCVRSMFDDGKGGMWGITTDFEALTLVGSSLLLGEYTEKGYWSLSEMLDFLESLPEDTEKIHTYNRRQGEYPMLTQGYGYFLADGTCTFESEEFIRLLEFIQNAPADYTEWQRTSPVADLQTLDSIKRPEAIRDAITTGKIALMSSTLGYESFYNLLSAEGNFPIGAATRGTSCLEILADTSFIITTFAEDPDLCFELVKSFFVCDRKVIFDGISTYMPLFSRKDHFSQAAGSSSLASLSRQKLAELFLVLDNAGSPILERTPTDVHNIVTEEMSAFLAGMGTAEDCAKKIQSRVEIWLAEHE